MIQKVREERMAMQRSADEMNETLVFLHGSGDSAAVWQPLISLLPEVHTVALDLPGHGALRDQPGPAEMSVSDYATFVAQELERRGLGPAVIVGHSLGGAIALRLALDHPALARRLALVGSGGRLRVAPAFLAEARTAAPTGVPAVTRMSFAEAHPAQADLYHATRPPTAPGMLYRDLVACDQFDVMAELDRISAPTLIIVGSEDRMTPPKYAEYLHARVPASELVVIPEAGHYVQIEQPQAVANALRRWLAAAG